MAAGWVRHLAQDRIDVFSGGSNPGKQLNPAAVEAMREIGGEVLITADHGNCEQMNDEVHQQAHTQHTLEKVPLLYVGRNATLQDGGALRDLAPTLLVMMGLPQPAEMTGRSLIEFQ